MRNLSRAALATVAAAALVTGLTGPAHATGGGLPLTSFGAIAVDAGHKHVFLSGGTAANAIVVTDYSGHALKTISGQYGATGLVLSADGSTLYTANAAGDAVSAIDTKTLTEKQRYATGAQTCPTRLARTGTTIWFGYGCGSSWTGGIGSLDTSVTPPVVGLNQQGAVDFQGAPLLSANGAANGTLLAVQPQLSLSTVAVYATTGATASLTITGTVSGSNITDGTLTPDDAQLFTAAGSRDGAAAFTATDLSGRGAYPTGRYPNAVAVAPDGSALAAGAYSTDKDVYLYRLGGATPTRTVELGSGRILADRGLAFTPDGKVLFVVALSLTDPSPILLSLSRPLG
ncbi:lactonase family protein [Planosporangium mesophilum]|uniref:Uncharacterized protein n=1 Tax=Planosporangium mesophilum TaxID=689768 RepID=A0A8J3TKZ2_9ACTN|nr:lactonase family protein [Planosporangium mesophilum]NJC86853.1 lactonase family protein [Planosporangium mesophilum]GII26489.1 hypothetical protein Pme01_60860 [Planosporangium mesophilum]